MSKLELGTKLDHLLPQEGGKMGSFAPKIK
jgi:hypothetical protein